MEIIVLAITLAILGLSQKEGEYYSEIAQLDELVGRVVAPSKKESQLSPTTDTIPKQSTKPHLSQESTINLDKTTQKSEVSSFGDGFSEGFGGSPPKPKKGTKPKVSPKSDFTLEGMDFESMLSATIDAKAFTDLDKNR